MLKTVTVNQELKFARSEEDCPGGFRQFQRGEEQGDIIMYHWQVLSPLTLFRQFCRLSCRQVLKLTTGLGCSFSIK